MKKILLILLVLGLSAAGIGYYMYQKPAEKTVSADASLRITAKELLAAFQADEAKAMATYAADGQVIEVSGSVVGLDASDPAKVTVSLDTGDPMAAVVLEFDKAAAPTWAPGAAVKAKGTCTGLLLDVVVTRCAVVE